MNESADCNMKDFVHMEIGKIVQDHEKMILGWENVDFTDENIRHLYNLFKHCSRQEIQQFEIINFLENDDKENIFELISKKLMKVKSTDVNQAKVSGNQTNQVDAVETKSGKKSSKKKNTNNKAVSPGKPAAPKKISITTPPTVVITNFDEEAEKKKIESSTVPGETVHYESEVDISVEPAMQSNVLLEDPKVTEASTEQNGSVITVSETIEVNNTPCNDEKAKKKENPFDNEHLFIEPLLSSTANMKDTEEDDNLPDAFGNHYISQESNALKSNLQKLATDISTEEQIIRRKMSTGEPAEINEEVLQDFIMRANVVLKETEAVTVRKIAEAETKKFLTSLKIPTGNALETISNELMQDIWPKSNRWRSFARAQSDDPPLDEINLKLKRKQDEQVEKEVRAAIKSAGEPLNKKQIGQIRKAVIVYRDFDNEEEKELNYRSDHALKLVELVSAYEASNRMDELIRLRLAIAFCTKRRDYFLKARPPNFMQFSYMYIYLLEKINSKTASICACLNYQSTVSRDFDELEELLLNLFHEDYFMQDN